MSENLTTPILGASSSLIATTAIGKGYVVGFHYDVFFYEDLCTRENTYSPMNGLGILSFPIVELSTYGLRKKWKMKTNSGSVYLVYIFPAPFCAFHF